MTRRPLTRDDLYSDEVDALRLSDVCRITRCHRDTILRAVERGELHAFQMVKRRGSPWLFDRALFLDWWTHKRLEKAS